MPPLPTVWPRHLPRAWHLAQELVIYLALMALMWVRAVATWLHGGDFAHFNMLVESFKDFDQGNWWREGPQFHDLEPRLGGGFYHWLNMPARAFCEPVGGAHMYYALLTMLVITLWYFAAPWQRGQRIQRWVSTGAMVLLVPSFRTVCENMTVAALLAVPLYILVWRGLRSRSAGLFLAAGALLGVTIQVHLLAVSLGLAVALAVAHGRHQTLRRLAALALGPALLFGLTAVMVEARPGQGIVLTIADYIRDNFSARHFMANMFYTGLHPLALAGIPLAAWSLWRRRHDHVAAALELAWLLVAFTLVNLGLACIESGQPLPQGFDRQIHFKHAMLIPACALLAARGVSWPVGLALRRVPRLPGHGILLPALALAVIGVLLMGQGARLSRLLAGMDKEQECAFPGCASSSQDLYRMSQRIGQLGLHIHDGPVEVHGLVEEDVDALIYWRQTCRLRARPSLQRPTRHVAVSLPLRGFDARQIRGIHAHQKYWLVDGVLPSGDPERLGGGRYRFSLHPGADPGGLLLVYLVGNAPASKALTVTIGRGEREVRALAIRPSNTEPQEDYHAVSAIFDLSKLPPSPGLLSMAVSGFVPDRQPALVSLVRAPAAQRQR